MSLPPILRDNTILLNSSSCLQMPISSAARSKVAPSSKSAAKPSAYRSNTFLGELPSPSSSSKGGPVASPKAQKPTFLSDRQMSTLGITPAASHKRSRTKSRLTTAPKKSASNTDLSSNFSSLLAAPNKPKLTRVNSENKITELSGRHRNFSDSNLPNGAALSRSFNRQLTQASKASRASRNAPAPLPTAAADADTDSDDEKEGRIVAWLLGVEDADAVTDQVVVEEPPRQTDTAIHIVYEGD